MVEVRPVIGGTNARKTTTIRALTGVRRLEEGWLVAYYPGGPNVPTYVQPNGLQEKGICAQTFIDAVTARGVGQVIVALRFDAARGCPNAAAYLRAFLAAGWNVPAHAVLGRQAVMQGFAGVAIPNSPNLASNEVARQVRANWGIA